MTTEIPDNEDCRDAVSFGCSSSTNTTPPQPVDKQLEQELRQVMVRKGWLMPTTEAEVEEAERAFVGEELGKIAARVLAMCHQRGWSLHWTARGAYLHLESSELIEAVRGKQGSTLEEAADVLIVLMSITENAGLRFGDVVTAAVEKVALLEVKPRYAGEEYEQRD